MWSTVSTRSIVYNGFKFWSFVDINVTINKRLYHYTLLTCYSHRPVLPMTDVTLTVTVDDEVGSSSDWSFTLSKVRTVALL